MAISYIIRFVNNLTISCVPRQVNPPPLVPERPYDLTNTAFSTVFNTANTHHVSGIPEGVTQVWDQSGTGVHFH